MPVKKDPSGRRSVEAEVEVPGTPEEVWAGDVPPMGGLVERVGEEAYPEELLLRLDRPAPGIAHLFAMPMGGQVFLSIRLYLYGDRAAAAVAHDEPMWRAWIE